MQEALERAFTKSILAHNRISKPNQHLTKRARGRLVSIKEESSAEECTNKQSARVSKGTNNAIKGSSSANVLKKCC